MKVVNDYRLPCLCRTPRALLINLVVFLYVAVSGPVFGVTYLGLENLEISGNLAAV